MFKLPNMIVTDKWRTVAIKFHRERDYNKVEGIQKTENTDGLEKLFDANKEAEESIIYDPGLLYAAMSIVHQHEAGDITVEIIPHKGAKMLRIRGEKVEVVIAPKVDDAYFENNP